MFSTMQNRTSSAAALTSSTLPSPMLVWNCFENVTSIINNGNRPRPGFFADKPKLLINENRPRLSFFDNVPPYFEATVHHHLFCPSPCLFPQPYLKRYGYMYVNTGKTDTIVDDSTALQRFQEFMGLPVTDRYDEATMSVINRPRCGLVDPVDSYEHMHQSVSLLGGRWNKTELTYK